MTGPRLINGDGKVVARTPLRHGTMVFLDGGTLELGIVRDSALNSTNDYQIFAESFEDVKLRTRVSALASSIWVSAC